MNRPITRAQLFDWANIGKNESVLGTNSRALAVNRLGTGYHDFADRKILLANDFKELSRSERVYMHILRDLRHVPAVCGLVKDDIDIAQGFIHRRAVAHIALDKLDLIGN